MYVAPEVRGQGIGQQLVEAAIARARQTPELEQLFLNVVTTNAAARALYQRVGFEPFGIIPHAMKLRDGRYLDEEQMVYWLQRETS
jgi:ribosomal protein S18 acetylase RimI-like enzyme